MTDELVLVNQELPEFFQVKLGNLEYEMNTESLSVSMTHQFVSKNTSHHDIENYDAVFTVTKTEIEDYLLHKSALGENFIDIFGEWIFDFREYHQKKNEPLCRDIHFTFSDQSEWTIKFIDLLSLKSKDEEYIINFKDPIVNDEKLLHEFIDSLSWDDVKHYAEEIKRPQPEPEYDKEWKNCTKVIIQWEETIDILDFLEIDDKIYEEEEDDQPL
jgi:hypothetical protein